MKYPVCQKEARAHIYYYARCAVYGLGETIVSGSVSPDTYIINKEKKG